MPSNRYTRIEITQEAYKGLEAEAILQGKTLKRLASELIIKGISQRALRFIREDALYSEDIASRDAASEDVAAHSSRPKLSENLEAVEQIKIMWSQNPRPSQREIARSIGYPPSSTKYLIKKMLGEGELDA